MALKELMQLSQSYERKQGISEERLQAILSTVRDAVSCWREYPDLLIDFFCESGGNPKDCLKLYFYQRVFLRAVMRHKHAYCTFPRAYSKSFLSVLALMLRCILFPGCHLFVTTGGKELIANSALA